MWDVATARRVEELYAHKELVTGLAFSRDNRVLASSSWDNTTRLWEVGSNKGSAVLRGQYGLHSVTFSPDGRRVVVGGSKGIEVWDVTTQKTLCFINNDFPVWQVRFSPDQQSLLLASRSGDTWRMLTVPSYAEIEAQVLNSRRR